MTESWWLKIERAKRHVDELKAELAAYANDHSYALVAVDPRTYCEEHRGACWEYELRMTRQPDARITVIAGDALFNLRSSLDHIACALVPSARRSKASFPIEMQPIWKRDGHRFVISDPEPRRRFRTATKGMAEDALAIVKRVQPYNGIPMERSISALYQLSRLNNADKHRQLVAFAAGLLNVIVETNLRGSFKRLPVVGPDTNPTFVQDRTHCLHFSTRQPGAQKAEVNVQISGTPVVGIKIVEPDGKEKRTGFMDIELLFAMLLEHVPTILTALEPHVRRR